MKFHNQLCVYSPQKFRSTAAAAISRRRSNFVCVISLRDHEFAIFILDLSNDVASSTGDELWQKKSANLRIRMEVGLSLCICVLGTSLFMFEENYSMSADRPATYKLDLHPYILKSDVVLESATTLQQFKGPTMNSPKVTTGALPTPDGKRIVVYSRRILSYTSESDFEQLDHNSNAHHNSNARDFEVFDPSAGSFTSLPHLAICYKLGPGLYPCPPNSISIRRSDGSWMERDITGF